MTAFAATAMAMCGRPGAGAGSGIFLYGNRSLVLTPGAGETQIVADNIDDMNGIKSQYAGSFDIELHPPRAQR